jgi:hypothetical protein
MRIITSQRGTSMFPEDASSYYGLWLETVGLSHGDAAISAFAQVHRGMVGRQTEIFARGYQTWRSQRGIGDSARAFADYLAPRYQRWRGSLLTNEVLALLATLKREPAVRAA